MYLINQSAIDKIFPFRIYFWKKDYPMMLEMLFFLMASASRNKPQAAAIKFMLENGEVVEESIVSGSFKDLDEAIEFGKADVLKYDLPMIKDEKAFVRFKTLWSEKGFGNGGEYLNADEFIQFFKAANSLKIHGEALRRFAENMVRRGLLGTHINDIISTSPYGNTEGWEISWRMLLAFAAEIDFKARMHDGEMRFYPAFDKMAEAYGRSASEYEDEEVKDIKKVSLMHMISVYKDESTSNRAVVFGWLLCHAGIFSSLYISPEWMLNSDNNEAFNTGLSSITRKYGSMQVVIEGLNLKITEYLIDSRPKLIDELCENYPNLKELKMKLNSKLSNDAADSFSEWEKLEKLIIWGNEQNGSFVKKLFEKLVEIKELSIQVGDVLPKSVAESFSGYSKLEVLEITGEYQNSSFVEKLVESMVSIPKIRKLVIQVGDALSNKTASNFSICKSLEELVILEAYQSSSFVTELLMNISRIKKLNIIVDVLDANLAGGFRACAELQHLTLKGKIMTGFFENILKAPLIDSLKYLKIIKIYGSQKCSKEDDEAISAAKNKGIVIE